jgi:hypothetical protein
MTARLAHRRTLALVALTALGVAIVLVALFMRAAGPSTASAADHLDAPGLTPPGGDVQRDITDVYAFRSPTNPANTVLVMNVNGVAAPGEAAPGPDRTFARGAPAVGNTKFVLYDFNVDSDGDAIADLVLSTRFGTPGADGVQEAEVRANGKLVIPKDLGRTTGFSEGAPYVAEKDGVKLFAGQRDDPFYFDLVGFLSILDIGGRSLIGCGDADDHPERDFFAGRNVSSIVLEVPSGMLTGGGDANIGVWAATRSGDEQVDRMGRPAIATVFIPKNPFETGEPSMKNEFNATEPKDDQARWRSEVVDTLTLLYSLNDGAGDDPSDDAATVQALADILLPDILTIDVSSPAGFLNGRRLADDVIDAELGIVTEGLVTTDCVPANDKPFLASFPYLASPH